jgi:hypothetical protein
MNTQNYSLEEAKNAAIQAIDLYFNPNENKGLAKFGPSMIVNAYFDLGKNKEIRKNIINNYEQKHEIFADVVSSMDNPNCSCRGRFGTYIENNVEESVSLYKEVINKLDENSLNILKSVIEKQNAAFEKLQSDDVKPEEKTNTLTKTFTTPADKILSPDENLKKDQINQEQVFPVYLEGNVIEIRDTPEAYGNLIKSMRANGEFYKGLNIVPKPNGKIWVYFY